jgi:hypothetical protein
MFSADDIQARLRQRPFLPVRIVTSSGQAYDVTHPDLVLVSKRCLLVGVPSHDHPSQFETADYVAVMHITDLQNLPAPALPEGNGQP